MILLLTLAVLVAQFALPRKLAFVPLLVAACHLGNAELLGNFTPVRLVIIAGLVRAASSGLLGWSFQNRLDRWFGIFSVVAILGAAAHGEAEYNPLVERVGLVLNVMGTYLYARSFLGDLDQLPVFACSVALVIAPLALFLGAEQVTGTNYYANMGARSESAAVRGDRFRARGPFNHSILSGTVGAVALPFGVLLWRRRRKLAVVGMGSSLVIVVASASSGPLAAMMAGVCFLAFWRWRVHFRKLVIASLFLLFVLNFAMSRPVWFLMARIDLVGGSTGWHRAQLIDSAIRHLDEWWLAGTDVTRHWMPTRVTWNANHCDLTNYYIHLGVIGGLPLLFCLIIILVFTARYLGAEMLSLRRDGSDDEFGLWCLGASIVVHAVSFVSVSYFGQMYALFYVLIGATASMCVAWARGTTTADEVSSPPWELEEA